MDDVGEKARRFISEAFGEEVRAGKVQSSAPFRLILAATIWRNLRLKTERRSHVPHQNF